MARPGRRRDQGGSRCGGRRRGAGDPPVAQPQRAGGRRLLRVHGVRHRGAGVRLCRRWRRSRVRHAGARLPDRTARQPRAAAGRHRRDGGRAHRRLRALRGQPHRGVGRRPHLPPLPASAPGAPRRSGLRAPAPQAHARRPARAGLRAAGRRRREAAGGGSSARVGSRTMAHGTHDFEDDARKERMLIWVNGELVPRERAVVSVFDAGFVLGDGVWEGLRVRAGHPAFLERHLDRLFEGAKAILLDVGRSRRELTEAIYSTLQANEMTDGVHVRLMVTRGVKRTPYQDPRLTIGPATVVIIAEHKEPLPATVTDGITLFTTHVRRAAPDTLDPKLNVHSKLGDITACIQAYTAGADEALMLDPHGFVATCNSTHFFIVSGDEVLTSDGRYCLAGITRANVLELCHANGIPARETTFSLTDVYSAAEAFVTGTFAGVVPVRSVDGRTIGEGRRGPVVERLQTLYRELVDADVAARAAP